MTLPGFTLPSNQGRLARREDYRRRAHLVLFFGHGAGCAACLVSLRALMSYAPLLGMAGPGLVILDRYGAPRAARAGHVADDTLDEALEWLDLMGHECPE